MSILCEVDIPFVNALKNDSVTTKIPSIAFVISHKPPRSILDINVESVISSSILYDFATFKNAQLVGDFQCSEFLNFPYNLCRI